MTWNLWWWEFPGPDKDKEPLQEDLIAYEKFMSFKHDRERMDREKAEQKARIKRRSGSSSGGNTGATYQIPDAS